METLLDLLILLAFARLMGAGAHYLGQPSSVGELLSGVVLALLIIVAGEDLPFLGRLKNSPMLDAVADLGIFFLILMAGLEMRPAEWRHRAKSAGFIALGGLIVPLAGGILLGWWMLPDIAQKPVLALLIGIALSITAIPATVRVFADLGVLKSDLAETVVAAAIFDDVLGIFLLAVLVAMIDTGASLDLVAFLLLFFKIAGFFLFTGFLGIKIYPRVQKGLRETEIVALEFSAIILAALAYGVLAEWLGLHWILGVYMAGQFFEPERVGTLAHRDICIAVEGVTTGVLGPLFFIYVGLQADPTIIALAPGMLIAFIVVAIAGKLIGAGVPAYVAGMGLRNSAAVGIGMSSRGAVELIVLSVALEAGLFAATGATGRLLENLYSALVLMAVTTTILSPILLRRIMPPVGEETNLR